MGPVVKIDLVKVHNFFIKEMQDLNVIHFNKETSYHTIIDFGPVREYIHCLPSEIMGAKFHIINMVCDRTRQDLIERKNKIKRIKIPPVSKYQHECESIGLMLITVIHDAT